MNMFNIKTPKVINPKTLNFKTNSMSLKFKKVVPSKKLMNSKPVHSFPFTIVET